MGWNKAYLGLDSCGACTGHFFTCKHKVARLVAYTALFLFVPLLVTTVMSVFRVNTEMNPANPMSRVFDLRSSHEILRNADRRFCA